ncbi:MAG: hypothetical protein E5Y69_00405 [Mesorhizobium sp.]|uniref:Uncharacterized protein n=1 Tax=Mesorhizobium mediterraneum TaxID=43617 RepID=A0AB36QZU4_9HYPH|nr:hypothetical protein CIT25_35255 [Mesorhizobium mediterraneum]TIM52660.1 MAG: hypothetical protein E5Y69_00405 [Mesorhizobium sp.]
MLGLAITGTMANQSLALLTSFIRSLPPLDERGRIQNVLRISVMAECAWKGVSATPLPRAAHEVNVPSVAWQLIMRIPCQ